MSEYSDDLNKLSKIASTLLNKATACYELHMDPLGDSMSNMGFRLQEISERMGRMRVQETVRRAREIEASSRATVEAALAGAELERREKEGE